MHTMIFLHGPRFSPFPVLAKYLRRYIIIRSPH
jgi:hypothetical protein